MEKDYSMYKFFKGESTNPFDVEKQNTQYMFWGYEKHFNAMFAEYESSDWYAFFGGADSGNGKEFMKLLSDNDYERPSVSKKGDVFQLWLNNYLFVEKLFAEHGGNNWYKEAYLTTSAR